MNRLIVASWLFLLDAIAEIISSISLMSMSHFSEELLFLIGSIFFIPNPQK
jgi:hypothetical protein